MVSLYRQAAKVSQLLGEPVNALSNQHKATLIFERVLGVDHPDTLAAYISLALYCHNTKQTAAALRLLYRYRRVAVYGVMNSWKPLSTFVAHIYSMCVCWSF